MILPYSSPSPPRALSLSRPTQASKTDDRSKRVQLNLRPAPRPSRRQLEGDATFWPTSDSETGSKTQVRKRSRKDGGLDGGQGPTRKSASILFYRSLTQSKDNAPSPSCPSHRPRFKKIRQDLGGRDCKAATNPSLPTSTATTPGVPLAHAEPSPLIDGDGLDVAEVEPVDSLEILRRNYEVAKTAFEEAQQRRDLAQDMYRAALKERLAKESEAVSSKSADLPRAEHSTWVSLSGTQEKGESEEDELEE